VNDLFEARQKLVGAFRRQVLAQAQYDTFRKQYDERAEEVREMSVGVRQLEREITLGNDSPGSAAELARYIYMYTHTTGIVLFVLLLTLFLVEKGEIRRCVLILWYRNCFLVAFCLLTQVYDT